MRRKVPRNAAHAAPESGGCPFERGVRGVYIKCTIIWCHPSKKYLKGRPVGRCKLF
jgi:hypothetical protein